VFLSESNVQPPSVIVHDARRVRVFVRGLDYDLVPVGRRFMVTRTATGRIGDEDIVFVDYQYNVPSDSRVDSYRADLSVEHAFDFGLTPYYQFEIRRQFVDGSAVTPEFADNTERHRFGLRFERLRWSLTGEAEIFNDAIEPYDAFHLTGRGLVYRDAWNTVNAVVNASHFRFNGPFDRRRVTWFDVDVTDSIRLGDSVTASVAAAYRWEDDSLDGETNAVDVSCGLSLVRGALGVDLTVEYDLLRIGANEERGYGVWVQVRRNLTHLIEPARRLR
jgi:hypothetical protein